MLFPKASLFGSTGVAGVTVSTGVAAAAPPPPPPAPPPPPPAPEIHHWPAPLGSTFLITSRTPPPCAPKSILSFPTARALMPVCWLNSLASAPRFVPAPADPQAPKPYGSACPL